MIILEKECSKYLCPERSPAAMDLPCRGTACMFWRRFDAKNVMQSCLHTSDSVGYCGKGGKINVMQVEQAEKD